MGDGDRDRLHIGDEDSGGPEQESSMTATSEVFDGIRSLFRKVDQGRDPVDIEHHGGQLIASSDGKNGALFQFRAAD